MVHKIHPQTEHNPEDLIRCRMCRDSAFLKTTPGTTVPMPWGNAKVSPGTAAGVSGPCFSTTAALLKQPKTKPHAKAQRCKESIALTFFLFPDPTAPEWRCRSRCICHPSYGFP